MKLLLLPLILCSCSLFRGAPDVQPVANGVVGLRDIFENQTRAFADLVEKGQQAGLPEITVQAYREGIQKNSEQFSLLADNILTTLSEIGEVDYKALWAEARSIIGELRK